MLLCCMLQALRDVDADSARIEAGYPFVWDCPVERPLQPGTEAVGQDGTCATAVQL